MFTRILTADNMLLFQTPQKGVTTVQRECFELSLRSKCQ